MSIDKIKTGDDLTQSLDIVSDNISKLKELFPEVITEGKIDFKVLQDILGNEIEEEEEFYRFTWAGKAQARREAHKPSTGTLRPCKEESVDWDTTQNLYIEGDNLEVLKLLQKSYVNEVKMIYIDPPYNTGKDFVYKDDYKDNLKNYQQITGQVDSEGNKMSTNSESDGRYHSNWLNMMYPRLRLARNLLREDGVIFMSIDDNEVDNLKKIGNEIFGENNFVSQLPTIMNLNGNNDSYGFVETHEFTLAYVKNKEKCELNHLSLTQSELDEWDTDEYGYFKKADTLRRTGQDASRESRPKGWFPVFIDGDNNVYVTEDDKPRKQDDVVLYPINEDNEELSWTWGKDKITNEPYNLIVTQGRSGKNIYKKQRPYSGVLPTKKPKSLLYKPEYSSSTATVMLKKLMGAKVFEGPKPISLIQDLITIGMNKFDIVLDFFSGSATSAHAVMQINSIDEGKRKFIQVQLPEPTDEKSEAFKYGYKTIAEIGKERIRRVGKKIKEENPLISENLDTGFKVFKLDSSNIKGWDGLPDNLEKSLFDSQDNIKSDRTEEDVLFEILLKYGLDLTLPIEERVIEGMKVFNVGFGALFICLGNELTSKLAEGIGKWKETLKPETCRVIFKDEGFTDVEKTNSVQTLKRFGIQEIKSI